MAAPSTSDEDDLYRLPFDKVLSLLQLSTVLYYLHETKPGQTGWSATRPTRRPLSASPPLGMALATIPVVVERGGHPPGNSQPGSPSSGSDICSDAPRVPSRTPPATRGFFYHFLDIETGRRVWQCELSTIDSAFLFRGRGDGRHLLSTATRPTRPRSENLADALYYRRADWNWACDGGPTLTHGWRP